MNDRTLAYLVGAAVAVAGIILALTVKLRGPWYPVGFIVLVLYFSAVVTTSVLGQTGKVWVSLGEPFRAAAVMLHGAVMYEIIDIITSFSLMGTGAEYVWFMTLAYLVAMDLFCWYSASKRREIYYTALPGDISIKDIARKLKKKGLRVKMTKKEGKEALKIEMEGRKAVLTPGRKRGRNILLLDNTSGNQDIVRATGEAIAG